MSRIYDVTLTNEGRVVVYADHGIFIYKLCKYEKVFLDFVAALTQSCNQSRISGEGCKNFHYGGINHTYVWSKHEK